MDENSKSRFFLHKTMRAVLFTILEPSPPYLSASVSQESGLMGSSGDLHSVLLLGFANERNGRTLVSGLSLEPFMVGWLYHHRRP